MNVWEFILKCFGWEVHITAPKHDKCVICVAPHTSNWDFILGLTAYRSLGRKANFLMKEFWFFFPLNYILKSLGGIPVPSKKRTGMNLSRKAVELFKSKTYVNLAITPEGTRSRKEQWHTGFLHIAYEARVPILLGVIDYSHKQITIQDEFCSTGNIEKDMEQVKVYYSQFAEAAKYPEKFSV